AEALQAVDDEPVVHDLVPHVDRRAELLERLLDDRDRAVDSGAEAAGIGEYDVHRETLVRRLGATASSSSEAVEDQQAGAHRYGAVGDVECRIVPAAPVEQEEIDHVTERHAVPQITHGPPENQCKTGAVK